MSNFRLFTVYLIVENQLMPQLQYHRL